MSKPLFGSSDWLFVNAGPGTRAAGKVFGEVSMTRLDDYWVISFGHASTPPPYEGADVSDGTNQRLLWAIFYFHEHR